MSGEQTVTHEKSQMRGAAIPAAALEDLGARISPDGLLFCAMRPDGTLVFHDPAANQFFQRFVLPQIQHESAAGCAISAAVKSIVPARAPVVLESLPGVILGIAPHTDRKQTKCVLLLAAKSQSFKL